MSNWRVFSESQDEECQSELELGISLSQIPTQPLSLLHEQPHDEVGPSKSTKQPHIEQR